MAIGDTRPAAAPPRPRPWRRSGNRAGALDPRLFTALLVAGFAVCAALGTVWILSAVNELGGPITATGHHDFLAFYAAATLVHSGHPQALYDPGVLTSLERAIYPHPTGYAGYMPFNNPPWAAALLAPLAALPESAARLAWLLISLVLAMLCAFMLTAGRGAPIRWIGALALVATFPAYQVLTEGQWSLVMLLGCLGALAAVRRGHPWVAGAALSVLWLNAPVLLLVMAWVLLGRRWKVAAGMVGGVGAITVATLPWTGVAVNVTYLHHLTGLLSAHVAGAGAAGQTAWEGALTNMEGLIGLSATVLGQQNPVAVDVATGLAALVLGGVFLGAMRGRWGDRPAALRYELAAVCLGLLLDPHLYAQDCVLILVLAAVVFARRPPAFPRLDALTLLAAVVLMDLSAIDTLGSPDGSLKPFHLLTVALIGAVVVLVWPRGDGRRAPLGLRRAI